MDALPGRQPYEPCASPRTGDYPGTEVLRCRAARYPTCPSASPRILVDGRDMPSATTLRLTTWSCWTVECRQGVQQLRAIGGKRRMVASGGALGDRGAWASDRAASCWGVPPQTRWSG